jgi:hypothetical protein
MGKTASGSPPVGWVLGPNQHFIPVQSTSPSKNEDELVLRKNDLHSCIICRTPLRHEDVTVSLVQWTQPESQQEAYPLYGERYHAHFSCGIRALQHQDLVEKHRIRTLQRVSKRLNPKNWVRNHRLFFRLFKKETEKVVKDHYKKKENHKRLLTYLDKAEQKRDQE